MSKRNKAQAARRSLIIAAAAAALLLLLAAPALAITYGEPDGNAHPNVGALVLSLPDGSLFQFCTGTLIDPEWVLTADFFLSLPLSGHGHLGQAVTSPYYASACRGDVVSAASPPAVDESPMVIRAARYDASSNVVLTTFISLLSSHAFGGPHLCFQSENLQAVGRCSRLREGNRETRIGRDQLGVTIYRGPDSSFVVSGFCLQRLRNR